jgi:hypothetical protein
MERYVVRDQDGAFFCDFFASADRFDPDGRTARDRALSWAAVQSTPRRRLSVWREDALTMHDSIRPVLVRRWPGQYIFAECLAH